MDGSTKRYHPLDGTREKFLDRLDDEDRHDEFDARVRQLKSPATTKPARQEAWWTAVHEFAPPPAADEPSPTAADTEPPPRPSAATVNATVFASKGSVASVKAIGWVASNVAVNGVSEGDAPDSASWALLQWVRKAQNNEHTFWRVHFPMLTKAERRAEDDDVDAEARDKVIEKVSRLALKAMAPQIFEAQVCELAGDPKRWQRLKPAVDEWIRERRRPSTGTTIIHKPQLQPTELESA